MDFVSTEEFLAWATARGIGGSLEYPRSEALIYPAEDGTWYRYRYTATQPLNEFVDIAVKVAAAGSPLWLFPTWRGGQWYPALHDEVSSLTALRAIVQEADVPADYAGAIRFEPDDLLVVGRLLAGAVQYACGFWE